MSSRMRIVLIAFALLSSSGAAFAHAHLKSSDPADKATLTAAPTAIRLEFSEAIELKFSKATVSGPGKSEVKLGEANHGSGGDAVLQLPISDKLGAGNYTVEWHVLSKDGHKVKGTTTFEIK